jgi:hypothetical protein
MTNKSNITNAQLIEYRENVLKNLLNGVLPTKEQVIGLITDYYKLILELPLPDRIEIFDSPMAAWRGIRENKCVDKNAPYVEPSDISIESAGYYHLYKFAVDNNLVECAPDLKAKLDLAIKLLDLGKVFSFDDVVVVSHKPTEVHFNADKVLHNPDGMSVKFRDGEGFYSLNGIKVPEYVVLTAPEKFTKEQIVNETNADVRREIVRKLSPELIVKILEGKVIDIEGEYELIVIDLGDKRKRPYLKMINPSIDCVHIEGVPPSCLTVKDAIKARNKRKDYQRPLILT